MRIKKLVDNGFKIVSAHQLRFELSVIKCNETEEINTILYVSCPYDSFMLEHDASDTEALGFISADEERAIRKRMEKENTTTFTLHCTYVDQLVIECRPDCEDWHILMIITGSDGEQRKFKSKIDGYYLDKLIFMLCLLHERYIERDIESDDIIVEHDKSMGFQLILPKCDPIEIQVHISQKDKDGRTFICANRENYSMFVNLYLSDHMYTFLQTNSSLNAINFMELLSDEDKKLITDTFNAHLLYVTKELSLNLTLIDFNYSVLDGEHDISFNFNDDHGFFDHVGFNDIYMMFLSLIEELFKIKKGESQC